MSSKLEMARVGWRRLAAGCAAALALAGCGTAPAPDDRTPVSLIVSASHVVTVDAGRRVLSPGAVAIDGNAIVAVDDPDAIRSRYRGSDVVDAPEAIVLPGLVNTHTHAPMVLYRGLADDLALMEWLEDYIFPAEAQTVSPEFVRTGTALAALEMIRSGTTTYADMYYFEEEIAVVTRKAGLRGVLGQTVIQFPVPDAQTPAEALERAGRFILDWKDDDLIVPAIAPHAMYTLDGDTLVAVRELAVAHDVPVLIHLAETQDEGRIAAERHGRSPTAYLESIGFWGPRTVAAHAVWLDDADVAILQRHDVAVSHNPESNMKLASGTAPVLEYLAAGLTVGLGTDGAASNNSLDMFEAMRQAALLHKLQSGDPRALPAPVVVEMATLAGARALGLATRIGSLEPGKRADLIVVDVSAPRQTPLYDPVSHLVYVSHGSDVRTTIVDGRILMRDGHVLTLDERAVIATARAMAERVREAVGKQE